MPVAARKRQHSSPADDRIHGPRRYAAPGPARKSSTPTTPKPLQNTSMDAPLPYVASRYPVVSNDQAEESYLEARTKARAARRRARRSHRPFRLSWQASVAGCVLLCQLVALLYMQGMTLSARNNSYRLDKEIAQVQGNVTRTQKEIAALDSSPRIAQWAHERGWSVATQDKLDSITNRTPATLEAAPTDAASGDVAADGTAANASAVAAGHKAHKKHKAAPVHVEIDVDKTQDDGAGTPDTMSNSASGNAPDHPSTDNVARHDATINDTSPNDNAANDRTTNNALPSAGDER
ncbi:MAG: hypothetical protein JO316_11265 [Abitibacteriaceae bacterium]|nr:hypothetical protein [Abditibacteriaceae bacterium]